MVPYNCSHINEGVYNVTIDTLNDNRANNYISSIVYLGFAILMGIAGNGVVIVIYRRHFPRNPANLFITTLAIIDLITCAFGLPYELVDLRYPYLYGHKLRIVCKISRLFTNTGTINSGCMLLAISYERYKKICYPLEYLSSGKAKKIIIFSFMFSIILASPGLHIDDVFARITVVPGLIGFDCSRDFTQLVTKVYYLLSAFSFIVMSSVVLYLYGRIVITLCLRGRRLNQNGSNGRASNYRKKQNSQMESRIATISTQNVGNTICEQTDGQLLQPNGVVDRESNPIEESTSDVRDANGHIKQSLRGTKLREISQKSSTARKSSRVGGAPLKTKRLTLILVMITIACYVTFVPMFIMNVLSFTSDIMARRLCDDTLDAVVEFCARSYVTNSYINPIIYSSLNTKFREKVFSLCRI